MSAYIRPTSSVAYHVVPDPLFKPPTFAVKAKCGRMISRDRIADGPRFTRPARVCVGCEREEISAT